MEGCGGEVLWVVVGGLVEGEDLLDFGGRGNAGEALLVGKAIFGKGEFEGGDGDDVMCGVCGSRAEKAHHLADSVILCDL